MTSLIRVGLIEKFVLEYMKMRVKEKERAISGIVKRDSVVRSPMLTREDELPAVRAAEGPANS